MKNAVNSCLKAIKVLWYINDEFLVDLKFVIESIL